MKDPKASRDPENLSDPEDPAFARVFYDQFHGSDLGGLAGMNQREEEELFLLYGTRKERKAIRARRKAREQAKKESTERRDSL